MPRKFLRRFLPSHATISANRHIARLGTRINHHNLWHLHRRSVAGGVAVGLFAGLIPGSNPVQFSAAALLAVCFHVNLPIAIAVTLYSNPFTIVPLYLLAFKLGSWVLLEPSRELPALAVTGETWTEWLTATFAWLMSAGKPLLAGIPLLALLFAITGYALVRGGWRCYATRAWRMRPHASRSTVPR